LAERRHTHLQQLQVEVDHLLIAHSQVARTQIPHQPQAIAQCNGRLTRAQVVDFAANARLQLQHRIPVGPEKRIALQRRRKSRYIPDRHAAVAHPRIQPHFIGKPLKGRVAVEIKPQRVAQSAVRRLYREPLEADAPGRNHGLPRRQLIEDEAIFFPQADALHLSKHRIPLIREAIDRHLYAIDIEMPEIDLPGRNPLGGRHAVVVQGENPVFDQKIFDCKSKRPGGRSRIGRRWRRSRPETAKLHHRLVQQHRRKRYPARPQIEGGERQSAFAHIRIGAFTLEAVETEVFDIPQIDMPDLNVGTQGILFGCRIGQPVESVGERTLLAAQQAAVVQAYGTDIDGLYFQRHAHQQTGTNAKIYKNTAGRQQGI